MNDIAHIKTVLQNSPLSAADKAHWLEIFPKLSEDQKNRLIHILTTKTDIAKAQNAIQSALDVITEAEAEAEADIKKEEAAKKATDELKKEINSENLHMPKLNEAEINKKKLEESKAIAAQKLATLREELAQISQASGGSLPPSHQ